MPDSGVEMASTSIKVYVSHHQKALWSEDAESLDMSLSEFIRSMVQAGRQEYVVRQEPGSETISPGGKEVKGTLLYILSEHPCSLSDLERELPNSNRNQITSLLSELNDEGKIRKDIARDKYVLDKVHEY